MASSSKRISAPRRLWSKAGSQAWRACRCRVCASAAPGGHDPCARGRSDLAGAARGPMPVRLCERVVPRGTTPAREDLRHTRGGPAAGADHAPLAQALDESVEVVLIENLIQSRVERMG